MNTTHKLLAVLGIVGIASAAGLGVEKLVDNTIPEPLKLKASKERVFAKSNFYADGVLTVKYQYVSTETVLSSPLSANDPKFSEAVKKIKFKDKKTGAIEEDISRRTGNAKFYVLGTDEDNNEVIQGEIYSGQQFIKDLTNNTWYHLETATITKEQFDAQTQVTAFDVIKDWIMPNAYADSATFYPDPNTETSSVDGETQRAPTPSETFATIRAGAGQAAVDNGTSIYIARLRADTDSNMYFGLFRGIFLFDTSTLPDDASISAVTFSLWGDTKLNGLGSPDLHIASSSPASNTALVAADFTAIGRTSFGNVTYANFTTGAYNDISLDSTGIATISLTGVSKFSTQLSWDINNSTTGLTWAFFGQSYFNAKSADATGTSNDPKLTVTYTSSGGGGSPATPAYIQFE